MTYFIRQIVAIASGSHTTVESKTWNGALLDAEKLLAGCDTMGRVEIWDIDPTFKGARDRSPMRTMRQGDRFYTQE